MLEPGDSSDRSAERLRMVAGQLQVPGRDIRDERVLDAMRRVPRHRFIPEAAASAAYEDHPVMIGYGQTISQPFIVALMTQELRVERGCRVLEIGTGSGYQAAILAELGAEVYSIERIPELAETARQTLDRLGYERVHVRHSDGTLGWPEQQPFDRILAACAPETVPPALKSQLAIGGLLLIPVGSLAGIQQLIRLHRTSPDQFETEELLSVRFVPMLGGQPLLQREDV